VIHCFTGLILKKIGSSGSLPQKRGHSAYCFPDESNKLNGPGFLERKQRSHKIRRRPGRQDHKPPGPLKILKMGTILKDNMEKTLGIGQQGNC
jgi:hypothetical protein